MMSFRLAIFTGACFAVGAEGIDDAPVHNASGLDAPHVGFLHKMSQEPGREDTTKSTVALAAEMSKLRSDMEELAREAHKLQQQQRVNPCSSTGFLNIVAHAWDTKGAIIVHENSTGWNSTNTSFRPYNSACAVTFFNARNDSGYDDNYGVFVRMFDGSSYRQCVWLSFKKLACTDSGTGWFNDYFFVESDDDIDESTCTARKMTIKSYGRGDSNTFVESGTYWMNTSSTCKVKTIEYSEA